MKPRPVAAKGEAISEPKLRGKVAVISGGDSGIGRAIAISFAREGADVAILYLEESQDAQDTMKLVEKEGRRCLLIRGDIGSEKHCKRAIERCLKEFRHIDIVVNNAAFQKPQESLTEISEKQLEKTFRTNIFSFFYLTKAALPYLKKGATIINSSSVTAFRGSDHLIDYSATKGAIVSFTRSLSQSLLEKKIRVNCVAPGPVWTPLIPATFDAEEVATFGSQVPMKRAAEPVEIAPCYLFLASDDSSYMTGQVLHPNGGEIVA